MNVFPAFDAPRDEFDVGKGDARPREGEPPQDEAGGIGHGQAGLVPSLTPNASLQSPM
jgi:hypothetical protein